MGSRAQRPSNKPCPVFIGLSSNPIVRAKVLLVWSFLFRPGLRRPSFNVLREICLLLGQAAFLPAIWGNRLILFDLENETVQTETLAHSFTMGARFCLMDTVNVLCLGGNKAPTSVYSASLMDCHVEPKADMHEGRSSPGLIKHGKAVYVFGGATAKGAVMTHCEQFRVASQTWTSLPPMQRGRKAFMPCTYEDEIYLADSSPGSLLEVFSPVSGCFTALNLELPDLISPSVSFAVDGQLVLMTCCQQVAVWTIHSEASFRVTHVQSEFTLSGTSSVPAVKFRNKVYWVRLGSTGLVIFDVSCRRISEKNFGLVFDD